MDFNNNFVHLRELYLPYKFQLLLRGSLNGFTPTTFHNLCNGRDNTVTFIKVKEEDEILGGYIPWIFNLSAVGVKLNEVLFFLLMFKIWMPL